MKLVSRGDGVWISEDGRVEVCLDPTFETECDEPHPVRMRAEGLTPQARYLLEVSGAKFTTKHLKHEWAKYVSYQCPGHETHYYSMWTVMVDGDWTDDVYETFEHALGAAEKAVGETITLSRQRRQKASVAPQETISAPDTEPTYEDILRDELAGIDRALAHYDELMRTDMADFVDQELHATHLRRRAEIQGRCTQRD